MNIEERIERAVAALDNLVIDNEWRGNDDTAYCVIRAAFPELLDGTAWLAPMEATGPMQANGRDEVQQWLPRGEVAKPVKDQWEVARRVYATMRDAHLAPTSPVSTPGTS